jgi:hypothetical protein
MHIYSVWQISVKFDGDRIVHALGKSVEIT